MCTPLTRCMLFMSPYDELHLKLIVLNSLAFWPWSLYSGAGHLAKEWNDLWGPFSFYQRGTVSSFFHSLEKLPQVFFGKLTYFIHENIAPQTPAYYHKLEESAKNNVLEQFVTTSAYTPPSTLPLSVASTSVPTLSGSLPGHPSHPPSSHNCSSLIPLLDLVTSPNPRNPHIYHLCSFCRTQDPWPVLT